MPDRRDSVRQPRTNPILMAIFRLNGAETIVRTILCAALLLRVLSFSADLRQVNLYGMGLPPKRLVL
jgi:hypothetical protein